MLDSRIFLEKLDRYPFLLEHLNERKIRRIFEKHRSWFVERGEKISKYVTLFCPLIETYEWRQN
jgi:hypothetical protein